MAAGGASLNATSAGRILMRDSRLLLCNGRSYVPLLQFRRLRYAHPNPADYSQLTGKIICYLLSDYVSFYH